MTKAEWREKQRNLPFAEKLRILEQLRLRDLEIRKSSLAVSRKPAKPTAPSPDR